MPYLVNLLVDLLFKLLIIVVVLLSLHNTKAVAQTHINESLAQTKTSATLKNKLYRQALFFYFSGNYAQALQQIAINKQKFNAQTAKSDLFNAGLQVAMGLQQQATKNLLAIAAQQSQQSQKKQPIKPTNTTVKSATSPEELLLIALLQLSEQQVEQGNTQQAQQTLAKIKQVSPAYYQQYYTLNQLAFWPDTPDQLAPLRTNNSADEKSDKDANTIALNSPYIQVNQALLLIENNDYNEAEKVLFAVKNQPQTTIRLTFWQQLFSPFDFFNESATEQAENENENDKQNNETLIQQQAIADYAQLLLAQLYVKQQRFNDAFTTLQSFPQHSPYSESALFLFAYAAQKTQQYDMAIRLFELLQQQYPYSDLGWQSALLMASQFHAQVTEPMTQITSQPASHITTPRKISHQEHLNNSLLRYQQVADFFSRKLNELEEFEQAFVGTNKLLNFSVNVAKTKQADRTNKAVQGQHEKQNIIDDLAAMPSYQTQSPWLQKALQNAALKTDYQHLIELDLLTHHLQKQNKKNQWINYTLAVNKNRQDTIFNNQQKQPIATLIEKLKARRNKLANTLKLTEETQNLQEIANATEQKWLHKIAQAEKSLNIVKTQRNILNYQKRLQRVNGVLQWQLNQHFIPRLWQHKTQLAVIDKQLTIAQTKQQQFTHLASAHQSLKRLEKRQQQSSEKLNALSLKINRITATANQQIKSKVQSFIAQQRSTLTANLLTARHAMAAILENMSLPTPHKQASTPPQIMQKQAPLKPASSETL